MNKKKRVKLLLFYEHLDSRKNFGYFFVYTVLNRKHGSAVKEITKTIFYK